MENNRPPRLASEANVSSTAETIESPVRLLHASDSVVPPTRARQGIALVEGSAAPGLTQETLNILRDRLRTVAIILSGSFLLFLIRALWSLQQYTTGPNAAVFYTHVGVTVLLALLAWRLCVQCDLVLAHLRATEFLIFAAPAVFFLIVGHRKLIYCAQLPEGHAFVANITPAWILLIFAYTLFVPNQWIRAAVVTGFMGIAPFAVLVWAAFSSEAVAGLLQTDAFDGMYTEYLLVMGLTVVLGVFGVRSIGSLRQEAFVARQLGQYRLRKMLGSGGMGEVYLAEHEMMKRPCAIKIIRPEKAGDPRVLARFEREVRATAKLSHWNSIDIYDYGRTADGTFYYVMEFLPGHNIGELVDRYGPLPDGRIIHLMMQVCEALAEAHAHGMVHRDIKPANIFCAYRGGLFDVAKLLDFGLAKPPLSDSQDVGLTQEGTITGSPLFMSPEQASGSDEVDARSDIYSLGVVMYYMATGQPPFSYEQPLKVLIAHASELPRPPREIEPQISSELEEVILRCLEKHPEDRFQEVTNLLDALQQIPISQQWSRTLAAQWWEHNGCPERKALAASALELAAV